MMFGGLKNVQIADIAGFLKIKPQDARLEWDKLRATDLLRSGFGSLKSILRYAARENIGLWNPLYLAFISSSMPEHGRDKFAAARAGDVFISIDEEARLVRWIAERSIAPSTSTTADLIDTALVICCYQFAMRPKQIGMLRRQDCRVRWEAEGGGVAVHLTFRMIKQKTQTSADIPLIRRVKREWAPLFAELFQREVKKHGSDFLLGYTDAAAVSARISTLLPGILNVSRSATDLRHSGAMRHVDAGASAEELAEYMGHSNLETGLVYFDTSASQAERVNKALGISETYVRLARLGKERFISKT